MRCIFWALRLLVLFAVVFGFEAAAFAQQASAAAAEPATPERQLQAAFEAARTVVVNGPAEIPLIDQATLRLPVGYAFVPSKEARGILKAMGNRTGDDMLGMIFPNEESSNWFVVIQYEKAGYIKDDDAKDWNADELLSNVTNSTEEANKERKARGIPELLVTGWVERPQYDATTHQLKWSISSMDKGTPSDATKGVNYNTYSLGRDGFITMNLVTDMASVESQKPMAAKLLAGLKFNNGKSYADFNSSTDKVAEYGLAALIGGIAAKKLGLLALLGVFVAKFAKVIAIGALALAGGAFKFWRKKPVAATTGASPVSITVVPKTKAASDSPPDSTKG